jgi:sucrose-6-phosphate hydrolase SacC (GH32 family)
MRITKKLINIPISRDADMRVFQISVDGAVKREFPSQLAGNSVDYWIFIDASEFKGRTITISGPATQPSLNRVYQGDTIHDQASLYQESKRPAFHFTVKRGWSNDVNGPIYYKGQYHLFWQAFPFGVKWDVGFMYWGHATSKDLVHWQELAPALVVDKLGSPWSGTSLVDHDNAAGFGKDALVLVYTAFDRVTKKQVQCIAYSTDNGATFSRFAGNPVLDSNSEVGSNDTRDPKVFWYAPARHFVMTLFEKDGMSFFTSTDLKQWTRRSHIGGFHECPDLMELPVDGNSAERKWVLHGGSSSYMIGTFDGEKFTPETSELRYAEGQNRNGEDILYAAQSFEEMPDSRRVQMAWGRIVQENMPFNQMMLFPTELRIANTALGLRLLASPIHELDRLHGPVHSWSNVGAADANQGLHSIARGPLDARLTVQLEPRDQLEILYGDKSLASVKAEDLIEGRGAVQVLIDKSVAEVFVNGGTRYVLCDLSSLPSDKGLEVKLGNNKSSFRQFEVFEMRSMWRSQ